VTASVLVLSACAGNATRQSRDAAPSHDSDVIMAE